MAFNKIDLIGGSSIFVNVSQTSAFRVMKIKEDEFGVFITILPGKELQIKLNNKTSFTTENEANLELQALLSTFEVSDWVPKTRKIAGVELSSDISQATLTNALRVATDSLSGIMSAADHAKLTSLYAIFDSGSENFVDTLTEILEIFENYPESTNLITLIGTKVDKTELDTLIGDIGTILGDILDE